MTDRNGQRSDGATADERARTADERATTADERAWTADERATTADERVATIRTTHADADLVAASLAPDDTDSIDARVEGDAVACTVERPTTGGLRSTVDDYVVNLRIAERVIDRARAYRGADGTHTDDAKTDAFDANATNADASDADVSEVDATDTDETGNDEDINSNI